MDVYLPTPGEKDRWKQLAADRGMTLSKWVVALVEETLEEDATSTSKPELIKELRELKEELAGVREKNRQLDILVGQLETELRSYRAQPFLGQEYQGVRGFSRELVEVLRETRRSDGRPKPVSDEDIVRYLGVKLGETEAIRALSRQLDILESYGLVESTPKGWKWRD